VTRVRLTENVVHRSFGAETVLLNLDTGQYHGLRGSGGRMLEVLGETPDLDEAAARIAAEFAHPLDEVRRDLEALCRELADRSLLVIDAGGDPN
jgi:coenzyme PQQ synthesis protein D (PqqD)